MPASLPKRTAELPEDDAGMCLLLKQHDIDVRTASLACSREQLLDQTDIEHCPFRRLLSARVHADTQSFLEWASDEGFDNYERYAGADLDDLQSQPVKPAARLAAVLARLAARSSAGDLFSWLPPEGPIVGQPQEHPSYAVGSCVVVVGLKSASQHNGRRGVVISFDASSLRYGVDLRRRPSLLLRNNSGGGAPPVETADPPALRLKMKEANILPCSELADSLAACVLDAEAQEQCVPAAFKPKCDPSGKPTNDYLLYL
jgi:hypothetical protein